MKARAVPPENGHKYAQFLYLLNNPGENSLFMKMRFIKYRNEAAFTPSKKCNIQNYPELLSRYQFLIT